MVAARAKRSKLKKTGWHAELIKAHIHMRGMTLSKLATDHDLDESACRAALRRPQPQADKVISKFLGVPLHELWPTRYNADGLPIRHVRDENTRNANRSHRLSAEAV